jgi:hypothetical protein
VDEGAHEGAVVFEDGTMQVEDGHGVTPGRTTARSCPTTT